MIRHVRNQLTGYCLGELSARERASVEAHLQRCARCRREKEEIAQGLRTLYALPSVAAPETLWGRVEAGLATSEARTPQKTAFILSRPTPWTVSLWSSGVALLALVGLVVFRWRFGTPKVPHDNPPVVAWKVERLAGAPRIGPEKIGPKGKLQVGEWLETDATAKARLQVASIGEITLAPNTRLRLLDSSQKEHRLSLPTGRIHAHIAAPPRLFIIETPAATAIDLGCTYTLEVNAQGDSVLYVELGYVALTLNGREAIVPGWAFCEARKGQGAGTPYFKTASPAFIRELRRYDFEGGGMAALKTVLEQARNEDTLTLWHLLYLRKATEGERTAIVERLAQRVPLPPGVTREAVVRLEDPALLRWKEEMTRYW